MLTSTQAPVMRRAALMETAFVEDGLPDCANAVRRHSPSAQPDRPDGLRDADLMRRRGF
ncbi:hypothetical protein [Streptomyces sp. NPDC057740]|uniref:hypothetical protein n=1 Tax=Streptomyces sp. NPDC057740 TaxID=3346234 RepID=UPI003699C338